MRRPDPSVEAGGPAADAPCPYCGSTDTEQEHPKGPGLCRSIYVCLDCHEQFERFG
jgi:transposase-like protein